METDSCGNLDLAEVESINPLGARTQQKSLPLTREASRGRVLFVVTATSAAVDPAAPRRSKLAAQDYSSAG